MNIAESRDFKIGGRTYRDTLIGRDVHQISNPATGHVYGEVVQIPADGRAKAYYLAGPGRERAETWEAAVQAARAQQPDPLIAPAPAPVVETPAPAPKPVAPPAPDTTGWLTAAEAYTAYGIPRTALYDALNNGAIRGVKVAGPTGPKWLVQPPAQPTKPRRPRKARPPIEAAPVAAADVPSAPEPKITIRPAHTKVRELETQLAELQTQVDALTAARKRQSWLDRLFGRVAT